MRVAILLGVSEFSELDNLEPVRNDVSAMKALLDATGRYQEILDLSGELPAEPSKRRIINYLADLKAADIDEVFFYFSGHGEKLEDRLSFPMSDWTRATARSNSIQNDELDRWLRELNPRLAVKIIDCCYAGMPYIKSENGIKSLVYPPTGAFHDCYFFLSSRFDQVSRLSRGERPLSLYTSKFIDALLSLEDGEVRYQQLVDRVRDLLAEEDQEPQFVIQGNARHVFCTLNSQMRSSLAGLARPSPELSESTEPPERAESQIMDAVLRDAEQCVTRPEAERVLAETKTKLESVATSDSINDFYDFSVRFPSWEDDDIAGEEEIGKWFKGQGKTFFGRPIETEPRPRSPLSLDWDYPRKPYVTGFASDAGLEYDRVIASADPKFPNLNKWEFAALILWSRRHAALFTYFLELRPVTWGRFDLPNEAPWRKRFFSRGELQQIAPSVEQLLLEFWREVETDFRTKFS